MVQVVHCSNCGVDGPMPATIRYQYRVDTCGACHHRDVKEYSYHFCSLGCMAAYVAKFATGLPCMSCHSTGFAFGFKENGSCAQCGGRGRVPPEISTVFNEVRTTGGR